MPPSSGLLLTHGVSLKMGIKMGSGLPIFLCVPPTSFPPPFKKFKTRTVLFCYVDEGQIQMETCQKVRKPKERDRRA